MVLDVAGEGLDGGSAAGLGGDLVDATEDIVTVVNETTTGVAELGELTNGTRLAGAVGNATVGAAGGVGFTSEQALVFDHTPIDIVTIIEGTNHGACRIFFSEGGARHAIAWRSSINPS